MKYVLPGMGADQRMYGGAWRTLQDCRFLNWPPHRGEESINEVARRVVTAEGLRPGCVVIGSSFGGMVACEIANLIEVGGLVLVGSARNRGDLTGVLARLHPLVEVAPLTLIQRAVGLWPGEFAAMFKDAEASFLRAMCRAVFAWEGLRAGAAKPLMIHGRYDLLIPPPAGVDILLEGSHLIAMTHANECVEIIRRHLGQAAPGQ
jgi:pimeloyl-ACP methyl ester carboxylesterase